MKRSRAVELEYVLKGRGSGKKCNSRRPPPLFVTEMRLKREKPACEWVVTLFPLVGLPH